MRSCKEVTRLVSESMDRPIPLAIGLSVWMHLVLCQYCRRFRRQVVLLREALRRGAQHLEAGDLPPFASLSSEVRTRIKQTLARSR